MMGYKGMCSDCNLSEPKKVEPDNQKDKRMHLWCFQYNSWCQLVARNCLGPETLFYKKKGAQ